MVQVIDSILRGSRDAEIVFVSEKDVTVVLGDFGGPGFGVGFGPGGMLGDHGGDGGFVEDGEVEGGDGDDGYGAGFGEGGLENGEEPGGDRGADAVGAGGGVYEGDLGHGCCL